MEKYQGAVELGYKKISVFKIGQKPQVKNHRKTQPQLFMPGVAIDQKSEQVIRESGHYEDQKKTGGTVKVKKVTEKKKRSVAQPCGNQQSLCIITNDYRREKAEKKKGA
ncbi:MAG: hypothetical protein JRF60_06555 [Deltaproteobacteria bacterium]|nr:hypothetical protein [Deltaproteobacteria bacterium]